MSSEAREYMITLILRGYPKVTEVVKEFLLTRTDMELVYEFGEHMKIAGRIEGK